MLGVIWDSPRDFAQAVVSVFAIVNPIGGLPVFVAMTEGMETPHRRRLFRLAGLTALGIIVAMALGGQFLLHNVFQIGLEEFAFGGGLLLVVVGVQRILAAPARPAPLAADEKIRQDQEVSLAVSPMASPMLVGPGSIVNVMLIANAHGRVFAVSACLVAFVFVILILNYSHIVYRLMGRVGALAVGRVMEIFIVAIGVKLCFGALAKVFPILAP